MTPAGAEKYRQRTLRTVVCLCGVLVWVPFAAAAGGPVAGDNLLWLALILVSANVAARLVERVRMPGVLGELLVGIVVGNLALIGVDAADKLAGDPVIAFLAELGVVLLLFQIGLESSLADMRQVGARALAIAVIGVVAPFVLGVYLIGPMLLPGLSGNAYLFLGAALTATSVGITGRVFRDLGCIASIEARLVLGAAVIDDVLGLVILAVVTSIASEGSISAGGVAWLVCEAVLFLAGSIALGRMLAPRLSRLLASVDAGVAMKLALILSVCLTMAWIAHAIGLAPIVGAFAAGLVLEPVFITAFDEPDIVTSIRPLLADAQTPQAARISEIIERYAAHHHHALLAPLGYFFVPVFFVYTGMQVKLETLVDPAVILVGVVVTLAAIAGKLVAGVVAGKVNRWIVGWGMVPRGEVGLIFAMVGRQLGVVTEQMFAVVVMMVVMTTLVAPPALAWLLRNRRP